MKDFIASRKRSFQYAFSGMFFVIRTQKNAWIHLLITVLVCFAGYLCRFSYLEWILLTLCIAFVWVTEFLNTAIEAVVDLVQEGEHPIAKVCKDVAAGAVLTAAISAIIAGLLLFIPKVIKILF